MKAVDLFAGGGGLSLGLMEAGMRMVGAFDNWQPAIDTYKQKQSISIL